MTPPLDALLSPQAQQAVIAGLFLAAGWWVVAWQGRRREAKLRAERVRDVQRALFAEIRAYHAVLRRGDPTADSEALARRIADEPGFVPIIPTEANDAIFRAVIQDLHVLPRDTIDPIVLYYRQLDAIGAIIADLRAFDSARHDRAQLTGMVLALGMLKAEAQVLGRDALAAIERNVDGRGLRTRRAGPPPRGSA